MSSLARSPIDMLKLSVIGSANDGKSTLIGRLLFETNSIFDDHREPLEEDSDHTGNKILKNLSFISDGLKAERDQGITIDVAYKYFKTLKRKFIISDCPGHWEYTRNMVTGTSNVNLSIILIDARFGVVEQTKRHISLAHLLNIKHIIVCINKMDLIEYSEQKFSNIKAEFMAFISDLDTPHIQVIPISALAGENIVKKSNKMNWYQDATLIEYLENTPINYAYNFTTGRFPIQSIIDAKLPSEVPFKGYAGRVEGGIFRPGDEVQLLPSGSYSKIKNIQSYDDKNIEEAFSPMSIVMTLEDETSLSRGDMIIQKQDAPPRVANDLNIMICWFSSKNIGLKDSFILKHTTFETPGTLVNIHYKLDIQTLSKVMPVTTLSMNDIAKVSINTNQPIFFDEFIDNRFTGSVIFIDEVTNETVAAGMLLS